jgi:uncharacterized protein (UPF0261 family)
MKKTILIIGTADTKADEIQYMKSCIEGLGGDAPVMDVGVLGDPGFPVEYAKHDVAAAANTSNAAIIALGDENLAMAKTAEGAANLTLALYRNGKLDGVIALGGSMGTDLALEVCSALPLGVPKFVVSTISYSHLLPPDRIPPDLMMILWAGGLYGLNDICKTTLQLASGAVLGAAQAANRPERKRPVVGMTSLGKSCLKYMVRLKPELDRRGFDLTVFHITGMGGRAFESLVEQGEFVAVMDFGLQELVNEMLGSVVSAGKSRLEAAGKTGIPQLVAPGCVDLCDVQDWKPLPKKFQKRAYHAHNRLLGSFVLSEQERRQSARLIARKLNAANTPTTLFLPLQGIEEWDRPGEGLHDKPGLDAFFEEIRKHVKSPVETIELDCHINDEAFVQAVLAVFDSWVETGIIKKKS